MSDAEYNDYHPAFDKDDTEKLDTHSKPKFNWMSTLILGYGSLGSIYGDIGTSPLYVLNTIFTERNLEVNEKTVFGAISCIFWVFTTIVIFKYCGIVLTMGPNNGEGGQVAIYCKISRILKTGPEGVKIPGDNEVDDMVLLTKSETHDSMMTSNVSIFQMKKIIMEDPTVKKLFSFFTLVLCLFGCSLVISDGLLTPTTSVLSAVDGIAVAVPSFSNKVMPVSVCILLGLFAIQPMGSKFITMMFSPIILVWFITILTIGSINISAHPEIFKALNPKEAIDFLRMRGGIDVLGPVVLSITGCEAMFADVGHFSPLAVQLTLTCFVYPCLMIVYLGQGAYLLDHPAAITNIFYFCVPGGTSGGFYWFVFIISTLATIVASQALIIGVFSILQQMIHIDAFPKFKIIHKSAEHHGRIFLPTINFILMIAVICTCIGFKNSNNVTAAYGLGVSMDLFVTTTFMTICMIFVYNIHWSLVMIYFLGYGCLEMCLVIANIKKVPHGAWFTIMVASIMFTFYSLWCWCRSLKIRQEYKDRIKLKNLITDDCTDNNHAFQLGSHNTPVPIHKKTYVQVQDTPSVSLHRYKGMGIMYTDIAPFLNSPNTVPKLFRDLVLNFPSLPEIFVFLAIRVSSVPYVEPIERCLVQKMKYGEGFYRCIIRFGFMDKVKITDFEIQKIKEQIKYQDFSYYQSSLPHGYDDEASYNKGYRTVQIFGKEMITSTRTINLDQPLRKLLYPRMFLRICQESCRSLVIESFFSPLYSMQATPATIVDTNFRDEIVYIGKDVEI